MQWIVPFMALLWIATSLLIGLWHITALPTIFATIFRCAFGWQEARRRRGGLHHQPGADQRLPARHVLQ
ncbi:alanine:cation symporter family protein [Klebsiella pneumoniae]|nr:alanine:cation symporter family protein [Klebsiella pneumoniae]